MRKIYAVGISPSIELITLKALELIKKAPVVLTYDSDFPFSMEEILKDKKIVKLKPSFNEPDVIEENIRVLKSLEEEWGVFLEIGDPSIRNPLFYHILGGYKDFEIETVPGVSSITAVFSKLGTHVRHFCMLGSEEEELLESLIDKCDLFVIVNIHKDHLKIFDKLKEHSYDITFVKNCCNKDEEISNEYKGDTYWIIAVARKEISR
ncbi:SAM-dependent methyltransferase [Acidianus brierleyi]|nr:SAM-dependent methyltransferase [Acidianus brierleyi]